uniref:Retrotransposon gag domain-containing protein n=1 Tax=Tanacetum cinerariifolium TaxID=118510 RepID=A0A6L2LCE2_TANCI|nr:hypothetical protein [Tanacetum cinerariifolium]
MVKTSSISENEACCSKSCKKNTDSLNSKITESTDKLGDRENMMFHYKLALSQVEARLAKHRNQEVKYCEKIRVFEFKTESRANCIESITKELELIKKEKEGLDSKLSGFQTASKDLDNLLESQRLDKNKEGLGYSVVPFPPAQVYSPPKKDMSWTGLPEFADDKITDSTRPSLSVESNPNDLQNSRSSGSENGESTNSILSKPLIKFVKAVDRLAERPTTNKVKTTKKSTVKYAELNRKPSKKSTVRGNQRNWNNLKSQQLGENFVMNKACFNCGDFDYLSYDCGLWVKKGRACPKNNYTHKSMPPRDVGHKTFRPPMRTTRPNMNAAQPKRTSVYKPAHSYLSRPIQRKSAVRTQSQVLRVSTVCCCCSRQVNTARPKAGNSGTKLEDSVRTKRSRGSKSTEVVDYILQDKIKLLTKKLKDSEAEHQGRIVGNKMLQVIPTASDEDSTIVLANLPPDHNEFAPAVEAAPDNMNGWVECDEDEEDPEEDPEMEEEEENEMEIEDEMNDPEIINPYEIEEGELPPPLVESDTSSDFEPEVEAVEEDENEAATVGTITRAPYHVQPFLGTTYVRSGSSPKVFAPGPMGKDVDILHRKRRSETREHYELKQTVSALEDQMRGLMLEDKKEKERLKKKLKVSQKEKEQMEQAFHHVVYWIRKHFGVEIPPCMDDNDVTTLNNTHPYEPIMAPKRMSQAEIEKLVADKVAEAIVVDFAKRNAMGGPGNNANGAGGHGGAPPVCECTFSSFIKCNPTPFHGEEGGIELYRWFEKSEMVFSISECAKRNKVKFDAATLQGRALTWWNSQVATLGLEVPNEKSWGDMKKIMMEEFCPDEEVQSLEDELRNLKLRDTNIAAYTQRFNDLVLLCLEVVQNEKKKIETYIRGLPKISKGR